MRACSIPGCCQKHHALGWCKRHHTRWLRNGHPTDPALPRQRAACSVTDCGRPAKGREYCNLHYQRWWKHGNPLAVSSIGVRPRPLCLACDKPAHAKGLCGAHYGRWRRHGDPSAGRRAPASLDLVATFLGRVEITQDGCILWSAATSAAGYGIFHDGASVLAHRWGYETFVGPIAGGLTLDHVCHTLDLSCMGGRCQHRRCVNTEHLEPVTIAENNRRARERCVA